MSNIDEFVFFIVVLICNVVVIDILIIVFNEFRILVIIFRIVVFCNGKCYIIFRDFFLSICFCVGIYSMYGII